MLINGLNHHVACTFCTQYFRFLFYRRSNMYLSHFKFKIFGDFKQREQTNWIVQVMPHEIVALILLLRKALFTIKGIRK